MQQTKASKQTSKGGQQFDIEALLDVRGPQGRRFWRVKWAGYPDGGSVGNGTAEHGWVEERLMRSEHLQEMMQAFWRDHRDLDSRRGSGEPEGEHRCEFCNRMFTGVGYLKTHRHGGRKRKPCRQRPKQRQYKGTQVDRVV